ncbi:hypothetical protein K474DRAFT_1710024 [Panus rudis PR-1116 ss-1]|nr:hypothetical protein K474DRAFT_1710024 [Panus rudis PR-1116 ss-1]
MAVAATLKWLPTCLLNSSSLSAPPASSHPARGSSTPSYYASQGPIDYSTTPETPHAEGQRMSRNNQLIHTSTRSATYPRENTITQGDVYTGYSVQDLGAHSTLRPSQSRSSKLSKVYTIADVPVYCPALTASPKDVVFSSCQETPLGSSGDVDRQGYATQNRSKTDGEDLERGTMIRRKGASTFQGREKSYILSVNGFA